MASTDFLSASLQTKLTVSKRQGALQKNTSSLLAKERTAVSFNFTPTRPAARSATRRALDSNLCLQHWLGAGLPDPPLHESKAKAWRLGVGVGWTGGFGGRG